MTTIIPVLVIFALTLCLSGLSLLRSIKSAKKAVKQHAFFDEDAPASTQGKVSPLRLVEARELKPQMLKPR